MYGKSNTHLVRLSGVIHVLNACVETIKNCHYCNSSEITQEFKNDLVNVKILLRNEEKFVTIQKSDVEQARQLMNYFNANKIFIAGYKLKLRPDASNIDEEILSYLGSKVYLHLEEENIIEDEKLVIDKKTKSIYFNILNTNGKVVETSILNKFRYSVEVSTMAFDELAKLNMGHVTEGRSSNQKRTKSFHKINIEDNGNDKANILKVLHAIGMTSENYIKNFNNVDKSSQPTTTSSLTLKESLVATDNVSGCSVTVNSTSATLNELSKNVSETNNATDQPPNCSTYTPLGEASKNGTGTNQLERNATNQIPGCSKNTPPLGDAYNFVGGKHKSGSADQLNIKRVRRNNVKADTEIENKSTIVLRK